MLSAVEKIKIPLYDLSIQHFLTTYFISYQNDSLHDDFLLDSRNPRIVSGNGRVRYSQSFQIQSCFHGTERACSMS